MKKLITAAILSTILLANAAFAKPTDNNNNLVQAAFKQEFSQAKDVNWEKTANFYRVSFKLDNSLMTAFFTPEGELLGTVRNIVSSQLPINLQTGLKKNYEGFWITELFEYARPDSNGYFITIENADQTITLQSTDGISWSNYRKVKK